MNRLPVIVGLQHQNTRPFRSIRVIFDGDSIGQPVKYFRKEYTICGKFIIAMRGHENLPRLR